ncbi:MAG: SLC13 family permease [Chloroflexi bacterium]|nr:SLC13 family permease [Chloroflexota bacterium]
MISVIILALVFILIIVRRIGKFRFQIWQIMALGAIAVLVTLQISPLKALKSINLDVMLFLLGMFTVGEALEDSGYLSHLSYRLFHKARSLDSLVLLILFGMGIMSTFLMNDTLAIIGTPIVLLLAKKIDTSPKILLLALAFAVTIGSVTSPIGNPQNLLIAINGNITNPFITFFRYLLLPTLLNLFTAYLLLRLFYRKQFGHRSIVDHPEPIKDPKLARLSQISLILLVVLVLAKIVMVFAGLKIDFRLTYIALGAASPIVLFSPKRFNIVRKIDWSTLIFFAAMFILMASVWDSGIFQKVINSTNLKLTSVAVIMGTSIVLSQFISNVPLVALYLPMLMQLGVNSKELVALAAGSTIAGNLSILGAASNVIIIQNAEQKSGETLTFWEFIKIGVPLTAINAFVYWFFFTIF